MIDMKDLAVEHFEPLVGEKFSVAFAEGEAPTADFELKKAGAFGSPMPGFRQPFVLEFQGPAEPAIMQQICWFEHPSIGNHGIFIVAKAADATSRTYEAAFN